MLQAGNVAVRERQPLPPGRIAAPAPRARARTFAPGKKGVLVLILACCFLLGLAIIAQYSSMVTLQYRLGHAEARLAELRDDYRQLELEAARLGSLARIELMARSELGMREPESDQLKVLTASREYGVKPKE